MSGHTDNIGTDLYNVRLSHRRVDSVMTYLSRKENVASNRFFMPIGFGESKPIAENATAEGRFRNRRVEFLLFTFDSKPEVPSGSALKTIYKDYQGHIVLECNGIVEYTDKILSDPDKLIIDLPGIVPLTEVKNYDFNFGAFIRAPCWLSSGRKFHTCCAGFKPSYYTTNYNTGKFDSYKGIVYSNKMGVIPLIHYVK